MTILEELMRKVREGASPALLKRLAEAKDRDARLREERAEAGRVAHLQPTDPLKELAVAVRAFRRAAQALRHVHGSAALRRAAELLGEASDAWRRSRQRSRRAPCPVLPREARRPRRPRSDPAQRLIPFPE